jgi:pyridoxal phosphate enzyme (YggS family)
MAAPPDESATAIGARLRELRQHIEEIARQAGRDPAGIRLVAVSKTHPAETVEAAVAAGQTDFGENTVQEALPKLERLAARRLCWHFIGHLQSNKARFIPGNFAWLHSLDSPALAQRLARLAAERNAPVDALVEINITRDPRKHGVAPEALPALLDDLQPLAGSALRLRGLMTIGPYPAGEREIRGAFAALRRLRDDCQLRAGWSDFTELSMGMSGDYTEAILEGSTMLRIGSAIFGKRSYAKKP